MAHQLPLLGIEIFEDGLQAGHRCALVVAIAEPFHHIALGLLHLKHRADGPAALGHHWFDAPGAADQAAHGSIHHLVVEQQRAMAGVVLAGDATHLGRLGIGVIKATDQVVDRRAARVDEQQHRLRPLGLSAHPVDPVLAGAIQIRQSTGFELEQLQVAARQVEQADADAGLMLELMGLALWIGAHHAAAGAADPVAAGNGLP